MSAIFYVILFVFLGVLIWQIANFLGYTKEEQIATKKENNFNGWLMLIFMGIFYIFMIGMMFQTRNIILPAQAGSKEGYHIDMLFKISMSLILFVQFVTQFLIYFFAFKYRGKDDKKATFFADSHKLEFFWTIIPTVVLSILIIYGLWTWNRVTDINRADDNPIYIELYAKQFQWEARYAGADNTLGEANVRNIKGINTLGVDFTDKNSLDDITVLKEIHLPKGRRVVFQLRSQDVLHSAFMPQFRSQMNCVPGMKTYMSFTPSVTTKEMRKNKHMQTKVAGINKIREVKSKELVAKGEDALEPYTFDYLLLCNKICGSGHYNMQMKVVVEEAAEFNKWLSSQKTLVSKIN